MRDIAVQDLFDRSAAGGTSQLVITGPGGVIGEVDPGWRSLSIASITKLVVMMAVGRCVQSSGLNIDTPVAAWFDAWAGDDRSRVTVRQVLGHTSGLSAGAWATVEVDPPDDFLEFALAQQLVRDPGVEAEYNNLAGMVLPSIIERVTGRRFLDFVGAELFEPLGIDDWSWDVDSRGHAHSMATLCLSAADLNRLGRVLLDALDGRSDLLAVGWVEECVKPVLPDAPGFGLGLFLHPELGCFGHTGSGGQHLWCYPGSGLVISRLRDNRLPDGGFSLGRSDQWLQDLPALGARIMNERGFPARSWL